MNNDLETNIELYNKEVWRRQKLFLAVMFGLIPYGILVIMPINEFIDSKAELPLILLYGYVFLRVFIWSIKCPCPICGWVFKWRLSLFTETRTDGCPKCGFESSYPKPTDHSLSLKEIKYTPGGQANHPLEADD